MIDADQTNFDQTVIEASYEAPVLVDFWAPWCGPCRMLGPVLEKVESSMAGAFKLVKINSDDNPALSARYGVRSIPYVVAFRNGEPVDQFVGALPEGQVRAFVERLAPRPGEEMLAAAAAAREAGDLDAEVEALRTALAINPALDEARVAYVRALLACKRPQEARTAFEPLEPRLMLEPEFEALNQLIHTALAAASAPDEAVLRATIERDATDLDARYQLSQRLVSEQRWAEAMDQLIEVIVRDKRYRDDQPRKDMLAIFAACPDAQLVGSYRRKLGAALN